MGHNSDDSRVDDSEATMLRAAPLEGSDSTAAQELGSSAWRGDISLPRGSGYPVKRLNQKIDSNGLHSENTNLQFEWRNKSHLFRGKGEKGDCGGGFSMKRRSFFLSIIISIVVTCFLIETMLQSSMTVLFRHTDFFPGFTGDVLGRFGERKPLAEQLVFGEKVRFVPFNLEERFKNQKSVEEMRMQLRNPIRPPRIAFISPYLERDPSSLLLITIAKGLQVLGYHLQVYAFKEGPLRSVWEEIGCHVSHLDLGSKRGGFTIDWSNFEGIIVNSIEAKAAVSSLMQEPFRSIPVIWIVQEDTLGKRLGLYASNGWNDLIYEWRQTFQRADVVVLPDYTLAMMYSKLDTGNFFVIPGSPSDAWVAEKFSALHGKDEIRMKLGLNKEDFVVLLVGSPFLYSGMWWEHTMAMQAIQPLALNFIKQHRPFKLIVMSRSSTGGYGIALQAIASHLKFPKGVVQHHSIDDNLNTVLRVADVVLYGSVRDEQAFPPILIRAMSFGNPVIAPNLTFIKKHIVDGVHGLIFPSGNIKMMTKAISRAISKGKLSGLACKIATSGRIYAKDLLASESVLGYAELLEKVFEFPSETMIPKPISSIPENIKNGWQWQLLRVPESLDEAKGDEQIDGGEDESPGNSSIVFSFEELWKTSPFSIYSSHFETVGVKDEIPGPADWEDQRFMEISEDIESREEQELEERTETFRGTWEDVYRNARKAERIKFETNERDEGELERTSQPLCIYEFYYGSGTWPFLHTGALYRGLSLSVGGRRSIADDVEAVERLPLLNNTYYKDVLCEFGGFFSIANMIDNLHKNPWIGFQSWHATGRQVALSIEAEKVLAETVNSEIDGDTVYFWVRMDRRGIVGTGRVDNNDFWSICDAINAGKCRVVFENAFRKMYDLPSNWTGLPPMPNDGDSWSSLNSWAMPTHSFLEFVMFSRMFTDALDAQLYEEHHENGSCVLGTSRGEQKHCYCRLLDLLVNVWAYHSARKMMYVDPQTGLMLEQHSLEGRRGHMWVKYFNFTLLKSMDEDLAQEADDDHPEKRWLWPLTGEVYWHGIYEREREERYRWKMEKKRKSKEKLLERLKSGYKQKSLGKVLKPPDTNTTDH